MKNKLTVGQKLWLYSHTNNPRKEVKEVTVETVSKKYFYLKERPYDRFTIEDLCYVNDQGKIVACCYLSEQDFLDEERKTNLRLLLKEYFDYGRHKDLTIDQLERIRAITKE
jgi:hypothetical protein